MEEIAQVYPLRLYPDQAERARREAKELGYRGRSALIRALLEEFFEQQDRQPPTGALPVEAVSASS